MIQVKATREGLVGQITATGFRIDTKTKFVALPSTRARWRWVYVRNAAKPALSCVAQVLDVGPWNIADNAYVFQAATMDPHALYATATRPAAESGHSVSGKGTNGAGIDLGEAVHAALGLTSDNALVEWCFVDHLFGSEKELAA